MQINKTKIRNLWNKLHAFYYRSLNKVKKYKIGLTIPLIILISGFFVCTIFFGMDIPRINIQITKSQGELNEIKMYRENLKDIDDKYTDLIFDILEKDYEIYKAVSMGNMSDFEAINILRNYAHKAYQLFIDFIMASDSKYYVYINYNVLRHFQNFLLQPWWSDQPMYERTWNIIFFEIVVSYTDNLTEFLYKQTPWGEIDLNFFLKNESQFGTSDLIKLINETTAQNIFWYNKTWQVLYNYSIYGIININANIPLYDRLIQEYYEKPLLELHKLKMNYEIFLASSSSFLLFFTFLLDIIRRNKSSKNIKPLNNL